MNRLLLSATAAALAFGAWGALLTSLAAFRPQTSAALAAFRPQTSAALAAFRPQTSAALAAFRPQTPGSDTDDEAALRVLRRLQTQLERNPRRGPTWERVFQQHLVRGSLDDWLKGYRDRVAKDPRDGAAWMLLGLIESRRGKDDAAVDAFGHAEKQRPADPLPAFYLGETLVQSGRPKAAEAFERAAARKPEGEDLMAVYRALARAHQQARNPGEALKAWDRLQQLRPDDLTVQEQIAAAMVEENQLAEALKRYEKLAIATRDRTQRPLFRLEAADLKARLARKDEALADYQELLGDLAPDHWLHREVVLRLEDVFLRNEDLPGLARYYEAQLKKKPDDVDVMARLARVLQQQDRAADAKAWLTKALERAPANRNLRLALIEHLAGQKAFAEADAQYAELDKREPNQPDVLRAWGQLRLRDTARGEADRRRAAAEVWKRLADARPKDPVAVRQVAELFRQAEMIDEALECYQRAVKLAPADPQFREDLGEYYQALKRPKEAQAAWQGLAEGKDRTAANLARLAEIYASHEFLTDALRCYADACELDKADFFLHLKYAALLLRAGKQADALRQAERAEALAGPLEDRESALRQVVLCLQASGELPSRIDELRKQLDAGKNASSDGWYRLARYHEAAQQVMAAVGAVEKAIALEPKSIPAWATAARAHEAAGDLKSAADANRTLASLDRRARTEYLAAVARLEARFGRTEEALKAGRELLLASPGNLGHHQFFADLCFQMGREKEGLDTLRMALRVNPNDPEALNTLAKAVADRFNAREAIDLYWQSFQRSTRLEDKLTAVTRLTELHQQTNQMDVLLTKLRPRRGDPSAQREQIHCLAEAYRASGDLPRARQELDRLVTAETIDKPLLRQLSVMAENEGNQAAAVKYQRQVVEAEPSKEARIRLGSLLLAAGEAKEATEQFLRAAVSERDPRELLLATQHFLDKKRPAEARQIVARVLDKHPDGWEGLYLDGVALMNLEQPTEAIKRFEAVLKQSRPDDELSILQQAGKQKSGQPADHPLKDRMELTSTHILPAVGLLDERYRGMRGGGAQGYWSPADFGQARIAALGWLLGQARKQKREESLVEKYRSACDAAGKNARAWWDWYYLSLARQNYADFASTGRVLARGPDLSAKWLYLTTKNYGGLRGNLTWAARLAAGLALNDHALATDESGFMLACYEALKQNKPDWIDQGVLQNVLSEMKQAGRTKEEEKFYRDAVRDASRPNILQALYQAAIQRDDLETMIQVEDRLAELKQTPVGMRGGQFGDYELMQLMQRRADANADADVLRAVDHRLTTLRRRPKAQPSTAAPTAMAGQNLTYYFPRGTSGGSTFRQLDYPQPNDYFDQNAIGLLRYAYELFQRDERADDLAAHLNARLKEAARADQVYLRLGLCYLHWWGGDRPEAVRELAGACDSSPGDFNLLFELSRIHEQEQQPALALAALDRVPIPNSDLTRRREAPALRLALQLNNKARAKQAAERLFALQLSTPSLIQLAGQMDQLGMKDEARTVLTRALRRPNADVGSLSQLMAQLNRYKMGEAADQVAAQILRSTGNLASGSSGRFTGQDDSLQQQARTQASELLSKSGRLKELIAQAEASVKTLPRSVPAHQALLDYYQAAKDQPKARQTLETLARLNPKDATLRYRAGMQLAQGDAKAAVGHFEAALKANPQLLYSSSQVIIAAFRKAKQVPALEKILSDIDFSASGGSGVYEMMSTLPTLVNAEDTRPVGWMLFRKLWDANPYARDNLLSTLTPAQIDQMPQLDQFLRGALLPDPKAETIEPWAGLPDANTFFFGARTRESPSVLLLEAARRKTKLEGLTKEIDEITRKRPEWKGGKALLVLIHLRGGNPTEGRRALEELLADKTGYSPNGVFQILAGEAEKHDALTAVAIECHERTMGDRELTYWARDLNGFSRLLNLYHKVGRKADGRALCLKVAQLKITPADQFEYAYHVQGLPTVGEHLIKFGYPVDALKVYQRLLADKDAAKAASENRFGARATTAKPWQTQVNEGFNKAMAGLNAGNVSAVAQALLEPAKGGPVGAPAIDWAPVLVPPEPDKAELLSLPFNALRTVSSNPELRREIKARLAKLMKERPDDLSVHAVAALIGVAEGDSAEASVGRLVQMVKAKPLAPLPPGGRLNGPGRIEAQGQVVFWLMARECYKQPKLHQAAEMLGLRAVEAARRLADKTYSLVILREWGAMDLERGDRAGAERRWSMLLELILPHAAEVPAGSARAPTGSGGVFFTSMEAAPPARVATRKKPPRVSEEQFNQAMVLAKLAGSQRMYQLSMRAVRAALAGGPIQLGNVAEDGRFPARSTATRQAALSKQVHDKTVAMLELWRLEDAPPGEVYETIAAVVMPEATANAVYLHHVPLGLAGAQRVRSLGWQLVGAASEAGRIDDLHQRLEQRQGQPASEAPRLVVLAHLGVIARRDELAKRALAGLTRKLETAPDSPDLFVWAAHAALPALDRPAISADAVTLLERVIQQSGTHPSAELRDGVLLLALARHHLAGKDVARGVKEVRDFVQRAESPAAARYRGYYLNLAASELTRAGRLAEAMEVYAKYVDSPPIPRTAFSAEIDWHRLIGHSLVSTLTRQLTARPARERYDLLRAFTLPAAGPGRVRIHHDYRDDDLPPLAFLPEGAALAKAPAARTWGLHSTADLFLESAQEVGQLEDVKKELQVIQAGKHPRFPADDRGGRLLSQLLTLRQGEGKALVPILGKAAEGIRGAPVPQGGVALPIPWDELALASLAVREADTADAGRELAAAILSSREGMQPPDAYFAHGLAHARYTAGRGEWLRRGLPAPDRGLDPRLALWHPVGHTSYDAHLMGAPPSCWVAHDGLVCHYCGPRQEYLFFAYPLEGTFDFSVEVYNGATAEGFVSYAGLIAHPRSNPAESGISPVGMHESVTRAARLLRPNAYNRLTLQARPGSVRYLLNGRLFFEDVAPSPNAPWLALVALRRRHTAFRNFSLRGEPILPREVRLTGGDRMDGWVTTLYEETQPKPRTDAARTDRTKPSVPAAGEFDWSARDGTLIGRRILSIDDPDAVQSCLRYYRPLREGEAIRYEFFYRPEAFHVHPALDRLTFLLDPTGVRLHWMTDGPFNDQTGYLLSDNTIDDPLGRRGKAPLPLKLNDWNQVRLSRKGRKAALELNGTLVFEREVELTNNGLFGLFHNKDQTAVKVRNVVLEGNWPKALTAGQMGNLLASVPGAIGDAERQARAALIDEKFLRQEESESLGPILALPAEKAYERLLALTMPPPRSATFHLKGTLTPGDPAPIVASTIDRPAKGIRVHTGARFESAALEVVRLGKQLGRLDALASRVGKVPSAATADRRGQLALQVLIDAARERDADVNAALTQLRALTARVPRLSASDAYWPEVSAALVALDRPKCQPAVAALLDEVQGRFGATTDALSAHIAHLHGRSRMLAIAPDKLPEGWAPVTHATAASRASGRPWPLWGSLKGEIRGFPGHGEDMLYLGIPLRGDFELRGEMLGGGTMMQVSYAGFGFELEPTGTSYWLTNQGQPRVRRTFAASMRKEGPLKAGEWHPFSLTVQGGLVRVRIANRRSTPQQVPPDADPWLTLRRVDGAAVRKLELAGAPAIPDTLSLGASLTGWRGDYYNESLTGAQAAWERRDEEIVGRRLEGEEGSKLESVLQYHRPLLEDGALSYEFFHEPGRTMTHPALDRLAFLVEPEGVRVHWLTDGSNERSGLSVDNVTVEKTNRRGPPALPLKSGAWNKLELSLKGDVVTIKLNDVVIYERALEASNQRNFGLFHYADETAVRVRKVEYRGAWPRGVPAGKGWLGG